MLSDHPHREPVCVLSASRSERTTLGLLAHRGATVSTVRRRARIVLMSVRGLPCAEIASRTGAALSTVTRAIHAFNERGMEAVYGRRRPGRPREVGEAELEVVLLLLDAAPSEFGCRSERWSLPLIAHQLQLETGVGLSPDHVSRWLIRSGVFWKVAKYGPPCNRIRVANLDALRPDPYMPGYREKDLLRGLYRFVRILRRQMADVWHKWFRSALSVVLTQVWIERTQSGYRPSPARLEFHVHRREIVRLARDDRVAAGRATERLSRVVRLAMLQQSAAHLSTGAGLHPRKAFEEAVALAARNARRRPSQVRKAAGLV